MKISQLMSKDVVVVGRDDSLATVKDLFDQTGFHHLLVVEEGVLFGVISDRDLLKSISPKIGTVAASAKDLASLSKKAHQIMTRKPVYLKESATVMAAVEIFNLNNISCIPIVNDSEKPVGIVSWRDIMREIGRKGKKKS